MLASATDSRPKTGMPACRHDEAMGPFLNLPNTMKRVLIVKITSLGDVVLAQPIVDDLHRAFPGIIIDWATDGAFADIPSWNPGVSRVFSAPLRQFKRLRNRRGASEILRSIKALRTDRYDAIFDVHGAYKSAIVAFLARARHRYGYQNTALGERGAAFAYNRRMLRPPRVNAVQGMRASVAHAMGYSVDHPPRFGLRVPTTGPDVAMPPNAVMFLHGASKAEKNWPIDHWVSIGHTLAARDMNIVLPWASDEEHERATEIAGLLPRATVLPRLTLTECAKALGKAALVVGVDTGLTHLAHAFERPSVMIFTATARPHFGIDAPGSAVSLGDEGQCPSPEAVLQAIDTVYRAPLLSPEPALC